DTVPPPTDTVPPPTDTVPPPTDTVPPPTDTVPPPTDTVPPPTDTVPPTGSPHDPLGVLGPSPDGVPAAFPSPETDALVAIVFGSPRSSAPPLNDPSSRTGRVAAAHGSDGAPGQHRLPSDSPGPSAPASAPAGSGGAPGGGFFFSGFAALVARGCVGLAGRSTERLITSVAAW